MRSPQATGLLTNSSTSLLLHLRWPASQHAFGTASPVSVVSFLFKGVPTFSGSQGLGRGARKTQTGRRRSTGALLNATPPPPPLPQGQALRRKTRLVRMASETNSNAASGTNSNAASEASSNVASRHV
jgi:hypothetical protein